MAETIDLGQFGIDFDFDAESYQRVSHGCSDLMAGVGLLGWDDDTTCERAAVLLSGEGDEEVVRYASLLGWAFVSHSGLGDEMSILGVENCAGMLLVGPDGKQIRPEEVTDPDMLLGVAATQLFTAMGRYDVDMVKALALGQPDRVGLICVLAKNCASVLFRSVPRQEG